MLLACVLAWADPARPLPRVDEKVAVARYQRVAGEGPVYAKAKNKAGPVEAQVFRDAQVVLYRRFEKKVLVEIASFDAYGAPLARVAVGADGALVEATAGGTPVPVLGWSQVSLPGLRLVSPPGTPTEGGYSLRWDAVRAELRAWEAPADPFGEPFREQLAAGCGCVLLDRHTAWLDGQVGVRYRLRLPGVEADQAGELFAFLRGGRLYVLSGTGPDEAALGPLAVVLATARWEGK